MHRQPDMTVSAVVKPDGKCADSAKSEVDPLDEEKLKLESARSKVSELQNTTDSLKRKSVESVVSEPAEMPSSGILPPKHNLITSSNATNSNASVPTNAHSEVVGVAVDISVLNNPHSAGVVTDHGDAVGVVDIKIEEGGVKRELTTDYSSEETGMDFASQSTDVEETKKEGEGAPTEGSGNSSRQGIDTMASKDTSTPEQKAEENETVIQEDNETADQEAELAFLEKVDATFTTVLKTQDQLRQLSQLVNAIEKSPNEIPPDSEVTIPVGEVGNTNLAGDTIVHAALVGGLMEEDKEKEEVYQEAYQPTNSTDEGTVVVAGEIVSSETLGLREHLNEPASNLEVEQATESISNEGSRDDLTSSNLPDGLRSKLFTDKETHDSQQSVQIPNTEEDLKTSSSPPDGLKSKLFTDKETSDSQQSEQIPNTEEQGSSQKQGSTPNPTPQPHSKPTHAAPKHSRFQLAASFTKQL